MSDQTAQPPISTIPSAGAGGDPNSLPVLNREIVMAQLGLDEATFNEFLGMFFIDAMLQIEEIALAIEEQDAKRLEFAAHTLKGSAATLGAERLRAVAFELEKSGKNGSFSMTPNKLIELRVEMELLQSTAQSV